MTFDTLQKSVNPETHTWTRINDDNVWASSMFPKFISGDEFWAVDYNGGPLARSTTFYHVRNNEVLGEEPGDLVS